MPDSRSKPNTRSTQSIGDGVLQPRKSPPTNEQDVIRVKRDEISSGILPPALLRDVHNRALDELEQGLLHPLTGNIAGDADVLALATNLGRREGWREKWSLLT